MKNKEIYIFKMLKIHQWIMRVPTDPVCEEPSRSDHRGAAGLVIPSVPDTRGPSPSIPSPDWTHEGTSFCHIQG